jgi:hypothetical protein
VNDGDGGSQPAAVATATPTPSQEPAASEPAASDPTETATPDRPVQAIDPPDGPLADPGSLPGADFGFLREVLVEGNRVTLSFDRARVLTGDERAAWVAENGEPDNDIVIVNASQRLRTFVLTRKALLYGSIVLTGQVEAREMTRAEFLDSISEQGENLELPVWMFHRTRENTGSVVYLQEQYLP